MHDELKKPTLNRLRIEGRTGSRASMFALISLVMLLVFLVAWFSFGSLYVAFFNELVSANLIPKDTAKLLVICGIASSGIIFYTVFLTARKNRKCLLFRITAQVEKRILEALAGWPAKEITTLFLSGEHTFSTHTPPPPETPPRANLA